MHAFEKHREVIRVINRLIKQLNEILSKQEATGFLHDIPQDALDNEDEPDFLINRIISKLIDVTDSLRSINDSYLQKGKIKERPSTVSKNSPERSRYEIAQADEIVFSQILETAQSLKDQIEEGANPEILMTKSRALFQDLLKYFLNLSKSEPAGVTKRNSVLEQSNHNLINTFSNNVTRSPSKMFAKDAYIKVQEEITGQLRHSVASLQNSNMNELTQQLQLQMDRNFELETKFDSLQKTFHSISLSIQEETARCQLTLEDFLAFNGVGALAEKVKNCLRHFTARIETLFSKAGNYYCPNSQLADLLQQFELQRSSWESAMNNQREEFLIEKKKLEDELQKLESALKGEQELSASAISKLESNINDLSNEKTQLVIEIEQLTSETKRLTLELGQLQNELIAMQTTSEQEIVKCKEEYDLEKQKNSQKEAQIYELEKAVAERESNLAEKEKTLLETENLISELQAKQLKLEEEFLLADKERNDLKMDKEFLKDKMLTNEVIFKELLLRVERLDNQSIQLINERDDLARKLAEKERLHEREHERITLEFRKVQQDYTNYVEGTHVSNAEIKQRYDKLISDYLSQIDEQRDAFEAYRMEKECEIRAKSGEIKDLTLRYQTAEELVRAQETKLSRKEERLDILTKEHMQLQDRVGELKIQLEESAKIKEKNKRYSELLTAANADMSKIKAEFFSIMQERKSFGQRTEALEKENQSLKTDVDRLRENLAKMTSKLNETVSEAKELRCKLESEQQSALRKEKELK